VDILPVIEVMQALSATGKSGVLQVEEGQRSARFTLLGGRIISATTEPRIKFMGEYLVERGLISQEALGHALEMQRQQGEPRSPLGGILLEMGLLTVGQVEGVLRDYVETVIQEVTTWKDARFTYTPSVPEPVDELGFLPDSIALNMDLNTSTLLLQNFPGGDDGTSQADQMTPPIVHQAARDNVSAVVDDLVHGASKEQLLRLQRKVHALRHRLQRFNVSRELLRFLNHYVDRGIIFLVEEKWLTWVVEFGIKSREVVLCEEPLYRLAPPRNSLVYEVVDSKLAQHLKTDQDDAFFGELYEILQPPVRPEALFIPLVVGDRTVSITYADNGSNNSELLSRELAGIMAEFSGLFLENLFIRSGRDVARPAEGDENPVD
jgi:hypothetical protein